MAGILFSLSLLAAACGDDDDEATTTTEAEASEGTSSTDDVLGPENKATGEPVKIGLISHGATEALDNDIELVVAEATVEWLNNHHGGMGGRPFELVTCVDGNDPAKAADCANRMIEEEVAGVVLGSHSQPESVYIPLDEAGVPVMFYATGVAKILDDSDNAFVLADANSTINLPLEVAKEADASKVGAVVIDVPAALQGWQGDNATAPPLFEAEDIELDVVPVPLGTADMTPQMQTVASGDPGVVHVLGNDSFCIAAFNGLEAVAYEGQITAISQCMSDATRTAVSGEVLDGIKVTASAPIGTENPSTELYEAVMATYADSEVDTTRTTGYSAFTTVAGFGMAVKDIDGEPTHENVIATIEGMELMDLPGAGGLQYRCDRTAVDGDPAVCVAGSLVTTLDDKGQPSEYQVVGNDMG
ncbi:MAG TPA: ABC transporter substrate-binding protein [Microthrixaceae bacterium]|nr:ABC transporter substrate-binding protein [Microthrixaceae bacterium]